MKVTIVECPFGLLAFNEEKKLIKKTLFPREPRKSAAIFAKIKAGKAVEEVVNFISKLQEEGYTRFVFENRGLARQIEEEVGVKVQTRKSSELGNRVRSDMGEFAVKTGFVENSEEFQSWMREFSMETTKLRVKRAVEKRDLIIVQAIETLDDLDETINRFMGRVTEWYGVHFPELDRLLDKHQTYARLVFNLGSKENFTIQKLEAKGLPAWRAEEIANSAQTSMGADLTEADLTQIQGLCKNILDLYELRRNLEEYLDTIMGEVAPNIKTIAGPLLGARLISLAGGLKEMGKMPSSTIQVLGAEKALFRSLKTGAPPPKHGIIFQHPLLHEAKKGHRGKVARAIAGKLAIAARADAFGSRYIGEELEADLEERINQIRQQ
ncbi:MAG: C/D box methylation guide ribonucleoprotein complex aNOP56 subunit [Thermoproteota archaeon]